MTDDTFGLSRRKLLGSIGVIGASAALGGAGTMAFFSDEENFENNKLVAGSLDLKVDWTEHYSDWSDDEAANIGTVSMEPGDGLTGFPSAAPEDERLVFVEKPGQFLENTAIESFPDVLSQGADYDGLQAELSDDSDICDLPADLDGGEGVLSHPFRTRGEVNGQVTNEGDPLINISDVKPGDFGEVTFSFHVCGNPGYVWLTGALREASENGVTEPEREDPDEDFAEGGEEVELLKEIRTALWYDTGGDGTYGADIDDKDAGEGDNFFGPGETLIPLTGSLGSVLTALESGMFPLVPEPISISGGGNGDGSGGVSGDGSALAFEVIVTKGDSRFDNTAKNWSCADYEERLDVGDIVGSEILNPETAPIVEGNSYAGCTTITVDDYPQDGTGTITLSSTSPVKIVSIKGGNDGENVYVFDDPVVLDGVTFTTPGDHQISNIDVCCPVDGNGDGPGGSGDPVGRCFPNSTTAYIGFEWWLPVDHANEIQTDKVAFDLGFYTEQCRHNDGSGQNRRQQITVEQSDVGDSGSGSGATFYRVAQQGDATDSFVSGPDTPPSGEGSLKLSTTGDLDRLFLYNYDYGTLDVDTGTESNEGLALADITHLSYNTYTNDGTLTPTLKMEIDPDGPGTSGVDDYATLNFEPYYNNTVVPDTWQTWDVLTANAGLWLSGTSGEGSISDPVTWDRLLELYPDATIRFGFGVGVGSGWTTAIDGHVDELTIGEGGEVTTYDFEPSP